MPTQFVGLTSHFLGFRFTLTTSSAGQQLVGKTCSWIYKCPHDLQLQCCHNLRWRMFPLHSSANFFPQNKFGFKSCLILPLTLHEWVMPARLMRAGCLCREHCWTHVSAFSNFQEVRIQRAGWSISKMLNTP
jgi:hypothetical protein